MEGRKEKRKSNTSKQSASKKTKTEATPQIDVPKPKSSECPLGALAHKYAPLLRFEHAQPLMDEFISTNAWCNHKKCQKLIRGIELYEESHESENSNKPAVSKLLDGKDLYKAVKNLPPKRKDWTTQHVEIVKKLYEGVQSVRMSAISAKESEVVSPFLYQWDKYLEENPKVAQEIDPYYVMFDFNKLGGVPGGWGDSVVAALAALGVGAANTASGNALNYFYTVAGGQTQTGLANARHFGGFMSGRHPGVEYFILKVATMQSF